MNEEKKEQNTSADTREGNQQQSNSIVERADAAAERLGKENERLEANLRRQEEIMARQTLGGRSVIGQPEKPKEETPSEFKEKFLKGLLDNPFR